MGRYEEVLEEYLNEDDDGKARLIYAQFGLAIYCTNCLEETFSIMLWTNRIFKQKPKTNKGEYSAVNYTTIPRQSAPLIPRQSAPLNALFKKKS